MFLGGRFIFGEAIPLANVIDTLSGPGTAAGIGSALAASGRADLVPAISAPISSLQSFNFGLPILYQQGFGNPEASITNKIFSGYIQDNLKAASSLTLNFGLRYDKEFQPSPLHRDKNNFGPRFAFSYSPESRTAIRGGYGVYYSPLFQAMAFVARVLDGKQISQLLAPVTGLPSLGISASSPQVWALARQPAVLGKRTLTAADILPLRLRPGITPPVLLKTDSNLVNPYSQQFSLGADREFFESFKIGASYIGNRGVKLIRSRNVNLRQTGANAFGPVFGSINASILQDNSVEPSGSSIYHGFAVSVAKRYRDHYPLRVSYTFGKAIDDTIDFITDLQAANQLDLRAERALSSFDQRHRLVISGVLASPLERGDGLGKVFAGVIVAPIFTYSSGHPFNLLLGFDANQDTQANTDRLPFAGRNTGRGPDFVSFDLRAAKEFRFGQDSNYRVEGIFEAFNLFNRVNFSGVNNVVGVMPLATHRAEGNRNAGPADPLGFTSSFDPRQIQLGVKFRF